MTKKQTATPQWVRLDNAAKIYPAARRKGWSNLFRLSATLTEPVDKAILQQALDVTVTRFPTIAAQLRRGLFWFYLQQVPEAPSLSPEYSYPLVHMSRKEMRKCAFRVIAYHDRIAVEFFHSLTDATGATVFLKSLLAEYLEQKHGIRVPAEEGVLDRTQTPQPEELEDSFPKFAGPVKSSRKDTIAWRMSGSPLPEGKQKLVCFQLPVSQVKEAASRYGVSITVFLSAVMMQALKNLQAEKTPDRRHYKPVKILIPVNLRRLFPSHTLRNFSMFVVPEINPLLGEYSFQEICDVIRHKLGLEANAKHMSTVIATNVGDEQKWIVRGIPLPIKNLVMKAVFDSVGEKTTCLCMSNMGIMRVPPIMAPYIRRMDFILGPQASAPYNCGLITWQDTIYINFIRDIHDPELERHFHLALQALGLTATVETNES